VAVDVEVIEMHSLSQVLGGDVAEFVGRWGRM